MDIFKMFSSKSSPKEVAKDRLKLILIHDRGDLPQETLEKIRNEILEVISKYIEIEKEDVDISLSVGNETQGSSKALVANIPIKALR